MKKRTFLPLLTAALLLQGCLTLERLVGQSATLGPANGSLVIVGGGGMPKKKFFLKLL